MTLKKALLFLFVFLIAALLTTPQHWIFPASSTARADSTTPYLDFNDFPVTAPDAIPGSSTDWIYTTAQTNPMPGYYMTTYDNAGWRTQNGYPDPDGSVHDLFYKISNSVYNSAHMGFETYGYLEIDGQEAVRGNSLRFRVTGGKNTTTCPDGNSGGAPCNASGLETTTKEHYLDWIDNGQDPVAGDQDVGHPYIYFANTSQNSNPIPFVQAPGCNRLSLYVRLPDAADNGPGGYATPPELTFNIGPYNGVGGHWYHNYTLQGGGWAHLIVDGHPQHNNAWSSADKYPYPSSSLRDMGTTYFLTMYRWYLAAKPYDGIATPPYSMWVDEIEYQLDDEPQNNETICSPSIMHHAGDNRFEVGFMDKYKNNGKSYSTYEVRYSFSQITNDNWDQATPAKIRADARFGIEARNDGKFQKWHSWYQNTWASFTLTTLDEQLLFPGRRIYFAIKDISQVEDPDADENNNQVLDGDEAGVQNLLKPVDGLDGAAAKGGRDYITYWDDFDYDGDFPVLGLIKRIDYILPRAGSLCPDCSGDSVMLQNVVFPKDSNCECVAQTRLEIGAGTVIEPGAVIIVRTPLVTIRSELSLPRGAVLNCLE